MVSINIPTQSWRGFVQRGSSINTPAFSFSNRSAYSFSCLIYYTERFNELLLQTLRVVFPLLPAKMLYRWVLQSQKYCFIHQSNRQLDTLDVSYRPTEMIYGDKALLKLGRKGSFRHKAYQHSTRSRGWRTTSTVCVNVPRTVILIGSVSWSFVLFGKRYIQIECVISRLFFNVVR